MGNNFFVFLLVALSFPCYSQWNKDVWIGSSLTVIHNPIDVNLSGKPLDDFIHIEYTWNINVSVALNERFRVGAQNMLIWANTDEAPVRANLLGAFGQFNLVPLRNRNRLFTEFDAAYGNYCACGESFPFQKNGLFYLGWGIGYNRSLSDNLALEIGFNAYYILQDVPEKQTYTQYIIGLEYRIFKAERKEKDLLPRFETN